MENREITLKNVTILFEQIKSGLGTLREMRGVYDGTMAFDFNSLDFFTPNENTTSVILAFLLNPRASHGQGDRFLKEFCEYLKILNNDAERNNLFNKNITVDTEHPIGNGRIDITVKFGDWNFAIGIENKIHETTVDQKNQLKDYNEYLCKKTKGQYVLYYLTPSGHSPCEESISENQREKLEKDKKLVLISYEKHIIEILERFIMVCKADKVQYFLKEFQAYLRKKYTGVKYMDESEYIKEIITKEENHEFALLINRDIASVKEALLLKVKRELEEYVQKEEGEDFKFHFAKYDQIQARHAQLLSFKIKNGWEYFLQFDSPSARDLFEGVENKDARPERLKELKGKLGWIDYNEEHAVISEWWRDYGVSWNDNIQAWLDMAKNEEQECRNRSKFTNKVIEKIEKVKEAINSLTGC